MSIGSDCLFSPTGTIPLSEEDINNRYKDATVVLTLVVPVRIDDLDLIDVATCSAFFIEGGYIVTASHCILHEVFPDPFRVPPPKDIFFSRQGTFFITVFNVNESGRAFTYEATLIGVDGAADIAVLIIDPRVLWNTTLPQIQRVPFFEIANSRDSKPGDPVYTIGNSLAQDFRSFDAGIIRNERGFFVSGFCPVEMLIYDLSIQQGNSGGPVINQYGQVISVNTGGIFSSGSIRQLNVGTSSFFFEYPLRVLVDAANGILNPHLEIIEDFYGNYYRYIKGFLGILLYFVRDPLAGVGLNFSFPFGCFLTTNVVVPLSEDFVDKELHGIQVAAVSGDPNNCDNLNCPGSCPLLPSDVPSEFLGIIEPNDIITQINGLEIGAVPPQIHPGLVTWKLLPGNPVTLTYKKASEKFAITHTVTKPLIPYPTAYDHLFGSGVIFEEGEKKIFKPRLPSKLLGKNKIEPEKMNEIKAIKYGLIKKNLV